MSDVLVVEDDLDIRELVATRLRRLGCTVRQVGTGESALEAAADARPDLVVLDVLLPGIDGWQVLRQLRAADATRDVPVLVLSIAQAEDDEPLSPGAFLPKPFSARAFEATVRRLLTDAEETAP
ncbi:response regulator [Nitriliruptoraceae bacterium ZYF776]|nr:response regulator [Profundirhabdus halotolerans]